MENLIRTLENATDVPQTLSFGLCEVWLERIFNKDTGEAAMKARFNYYFLRQNPNVQKCILQGFINELS